MQCKGAAKWYLVSFKKKKQTRSEKTGPPAKSPEIPEKKGVPGRRKERENPKREKGGRVKGEGKLSFHPAGKSQSPRSSLSYEGGKKRERAYVTGEKNFLRETRS